MATAKVDTLHPQMRALYHYGVKISLKELISAARYIKRGKAKFIKKIGSASVYEVIIQDVKMLAVYDSSVQRIKTFYKKSYLTPKKEKRKKPKDGRRNARQRGRRRPPEVEDPYAEL